jgi:hypothetical protein
VERGSRRLEVIGNKRQFEDPILCASDGWSGLNLLGRSQYDKHRYVKAYYGKNSLDISQQ